MDSNRLQGPVPSLANTLDEPSFSLAQNYPIPIAPLEPQKAITILLDQRDDIIFAYLTFARSSNHKPLYFPGNGSLSREQFLAVCALRDCADDEIRIWLEQARKLCETV